MRQRDYIPRMGKVTKIKNLTSDTVGLTIKFTGAPFHFVPGQFVMLSVLGFGESPIGIANASGNSREIEVAVRGMGDVTKKICTLSEGDAIGVSGPFGNGLPMSKLYDRDVVVIAGGLGLPPLRSFIKEIEKNPKLVKSLTILYGARTPDDLLYRNEFSQWDKFSNTFLTVDRADKKWKGNIGIITELFKKAEIKKGSVLLACGPPVMFKAVIDRYAGKSVAEEDLYLFLERKMQCGIGKCQHCTCGKDYVCLDGPVFPYNRLKYNEEAFK
jgi:sulfhydrogenase subunit gamma (sulfur reductase)